MSCLFLQDEIEEDEEEMEKQRQLELGRGNRARKETNYDDQVFF